MKLPVHYLSKTPKYIWNKLKISYYFVFILTFFAICFIIAVSATDSFAGTTLENQVVSSINTERQKKGLAPLNIVSTIEKAALSHNQVMENCRQKTGNVDGCFAHQVSKLNEPVLKDRLIQAGYNPLAWAENIAWGYKDPQQTVQAWMNSAGHRENILNANYKDIGCSFLDGANGNYQGLFWTCDFGKTSTSQNPTPKSVTVSASVPKVPMTAKTTPKSTVKPATKPKVTAKPRITTKPVPVPTSNPRATVSAQPESTSSAELTSKILSIPVVTYNVPNQLLADKPTIDLSHILDSLNIQNIQKYSFADISILPQIRR